MCGVPGKKPAIAAVYGAYPLQATTYCERKERYAGGTGASFGALDTNGTNNTQPCIVTEFTSTSSWADLSTETPDRTIVGTYRPD